MKRIIKAIEADRNSRLANMGPATVGVQSAYDAGLKDGYAYAIQEIACIEIDDAMLVAFREHWHQADEERDYGNRVRRGIVAALDSDTGENHDR